MLASVEKQQREILESFKLQYQTSLQSQLDKRDYTLRQQMTAQEQRIQESIQSLMSLSIDNISNTPDTHIQQQLATIETSIAETQEQVSSSILATNTKIDSFLHSQNDIKSKPIDIDVKWLQDDIHQYPLLKASIKKYNHWNVFKQNLGDTVLKNDSVTACSDFWEHVNMALTSTLQTNKGLPSFNNLSSKSDPILTLLPAKTDHRYAECSQVYTYFSRTLHTKLTNVNTINQTQCPRAYNVLQAHRVNLTGFELLMKLLTSLCPQLGGIAPASEDIVTNLTYHPGEQLSDFHCRALIAHNEIILRKDLTGQANAIVGKYITLLYELNIPQYSNILHVHYTDWHLHKAIYNNHLIVFKHTLPDIYNHLMLLKVPTTFPQATTTSLTSQPLIGQLHNPPIINKVTTPQKSKYPISDIKYPGNQGIRYKRGSTYNTSRLQNKPNPKTCTACGLNNYDIIKGVNTLHTGNPSECPFRSPAHIRPKNVRESIIQYNFTHSMQPPKYDKNIQINSNKHRVATLPKAHVSYATDEVIDIDDITSNQDLIDIEVTDDNKDDDDISQSSSPPIPSHEPIVGMAANDFTLIDQLLQDPGDITSLQA